ncbi:hypothetical protein [Brucella sp. IR073]|uniref:hypothetical protein n=1 Tax=unclassified Brucella TaxID=2632610 RepID=UPI003B980067
MAEDWIAGAIKKPGSLRATAKRDGLIKGNEPLTRADLHKFADSHSATTRRRAQLAETLGKIRKD